MKKEARLFACIRVQVIQRALSRIGMLIVLCLVASCDYAQGGRSYYVDSRNGNDQHPGTERQSAWKTLSRLNGVRLLPGDSVCFKRGSTFTGPLFIESSGAAGHYIVLTDYGAAEDPAPSFTNPVFEQGNFGNCIRIRGSYVLVEHLYFCHTAAYVPGKYQSDGGWIEWEMGAIYVDKGAEHCIVRNNEFFDCVAGIRSYGKHALIEGNYIHDCNRPLRKWNWGPKGIWLGGDYQTVKHNRVLNMIYMDPRMKSAGSGGGAFEIDDGRFPKSHIELSHNYTRENHGFLEVVFNDVVADPDYRNFRITFNVADDYQSFVKLRKARNCVVDNNTVFRRRINSNEAGVFILKTNEARDTFRNNIIVTAPGVRIFKFNGGRPGIVVRNNLFYSGGGAVDFGDGDEGASAVIADPLFVDAGLDNDVSGFSLKEGSPAIGRGLDLGYGKDILGHATGVVPDLGAIVYAPGMAVREPRSFYIDPVRGSDSNNGTCEAAPWKTLARIGQTKFIPGDSIRFKRGSSFTGPLHFSGSGSAKRYITLCDYGPASDPAPSFTNAVFEQGNFGNCIRIGGSYVKVENLYFHHTAAYAEGDYQTDGGWPVWEMGAIHIERGAQHCIVRNNEIEDCVAGIRSNGEHAVIEHNYIHDCNRILKRWNWGPLGIWLGADYQEVRFNRIVNYGAVDPRIHWGPDAYGGGADGGAMEIDDARFDKSHISIHHNYTRGCQGFLEVTWTDVKQKPRYTNFSIHHNVSDDYQQFIALWRGARCRIEHNTIIRRRVNANDWGVFNITQFHSKNLVRNNIIVTEKGIRIFNRGKNGDAQPQTIISHNLYFAAHGKLNMGLEGPGDAAVYGDPMFRNYEQGTRAEDFAITRFSAAIDRAQAPDYDKDSDRRDRSQCGRPDIGAFEYPGGDMLQGAKPEPVDYVNPFIGTANQKPGMVNWKNGETFPGAVVPWGMVSVSPHNAPGSKSGYRRGEPYLYGFGQVHLSGVGCSDLGNVVLMPTAGGLEVDPEQYKSGYGQEEASAGFYRCRLEPSGIVAAMSATARTSISAYTFPGTDTIGNILIDASFTLNNKYMPAPGYVKIVSANEAEGWTESGHFCGAAGQTQRVYFVARFSENVDSAGTWQGGKISLQVEQEGRGAGAFFRFRHHGSRTIYVKVGISYVSIGNARANLVAEQAGWDLAGTRAKARKQWNEVLGRIEVKGGEAAQKIIFYTALYHMLLHPGVFNDANGEYLSMGHQKVKKVKAGADYYHVYSLWDTWRNLHVFLTLFYPRQQLEMVHSLLDRFKDSHWLPKWELAGNDAYVMVGDPAGNVLLESYRNGLRDFDLPLAYEAMRHNATDTVDNPIRPYLKEYLSLGYVPASVRGSVSMTLEYAMADHSVSELARILGKEADYRLFRDRSRYYKNLFDSSTGFFRPRHRNGTWYEPFDPKQFKGTGFIEGSAWNYLFFVPFDVEGLQGLLGGLQQFEKRLGQFFDAGHFALYNEPDIAFPYLFHYLPGGRGRTVAAVQRGMAENFGTGPGGLPGNDDCGTLSAWYVFSALGFYPDDPTSGLFSLGLPLFPEVVIHLDGRKEQGRTFTISVDRTPGGKPGVGAVRLNGKVLDKPFISYRDIVNGGSLRFEGGEVPRHGGQAQSH